MMGIVVIDSDADKAVVIVENKNTTAQKSVTKIMSKVLHPTLQPKAER
jgi:hypothetical protein